jgi:hypothetical protein
MHSVIQVTLLSVEKASFHLSIPAFIGERPIHMLIDTGASRTVFDASRFREFHPGSKSLNMDNQDVISTGIGTDALEISMIRIKDLRIGDWVARTYTSVLIDLSNVNQTYTMLGIQPIDGILGGDLLLKLKAIIDYQKRQLKITFRKFNPQR